jgi:molybdenum cofactor cytidylyltransferase
MSEVSALLLAAGESRRMGGRNKLLLPVGGEPLLRRCAHTLLDSPVSQLVVVLGHEAERVRPALDGLALTMVENEHYREGQMTSVHAGLAALTAPCDAVMICLADQPLLDPEDIRRLTEAFAETDRAVLVPTHRGRRGNPIMLSWPHRGEILAGQRNLGCRHFIEKHPALVSTVEMPNDHVLFDLDTQEDYRILQVRLGAQARWAMTA